MAFAELVLMCTIKGACDRSPMCYPIYDNVWGWAITLCQERMCWRRLWCWIGVTVDYTGVLLVIGRRRRLVCIIGRGSIGLIGSIGNLSIIVVTIVTQLCLSFSLLPLLYVSLSAWLLDQTSFCTN